MTNVDEIAEALRSARRRLAYAQEQLARHQRSEPSDHYALIRHQHAERSLRDDIAIAESDITVLRVELPEPRRTTLTPLEGEASHRFSLAIHRHSAN